MKTKPRSISKLLPWALAGLGLIVALFFIQKSYFLSKTLKGGKQQADNYSQQTNTVTEIPKTELSQEDLNTQPPSPNNEGNMLIEYYLIHLKNDPSILKQYLDYDGDIDDLNFTNKNQLIPHGSPFLYKIQTHDTKGWLISYNTQDSLRLVFLNMETKQGYVVANSKEVSYTGNSGGVWFPIAFTKDDEKLVMCSVMGDPGAGGSGISYGCLLLPLEPLDGKEFYLWQSASELPSSYVNPIFSYDAMGKTIYTTQGNKTPHHSQPGPSTASVIMYRNLVTNTTKKLLEETDTTYLLKSIDEKASTLTFEATKYKFTASCPRGDGGNMDESLDCAEVASTSIRTISLP